MSGRAWASCLAGLVLFAALGSLPGGARAAEPAAAPARVAVGMYLRNVPDLDLKTNSYLADFYLWFRWKPVEGMDPSRSFEFTNAVQAWDLRQTPLYVDAQGAPVPETMPNGELYQIYHVHGRFQNPFDLRNYPFDHQQIRIEIEESEALADDLIYVHDFDGSPYDQSLVIPGWSIAGAKVRADRNVYPTSFGDLRNGGGQDAYSRLTYALKVERPLKGYLVKTVLPITVVMLITFVVFFIDLRYFEGRIGVAITGLISAVALQLTSADDLPSVGYMVLLDKIYNLSYVIIFIALAESVAAVRLMDAGMPHRARQLDRFAFMACSLIFFGGSLFVSLNL